VAYQGDAADRVASWRRGDEYGERIPTGFPALDVVLRGGPTRGEVFYFLAPPKGAKTAALLRVALQAARRRLGVYVVTYEMQAIRMALRMDRMLSRQSKEELRDDAARLETALRGLRLSGGAEITIDERAPQQRGSVAAVVARVKQLRREGRRVDVVVLDYLNIMGASREEREKRHELARVSRDIAAAGRELDVLVWSAALVNRAAVNKRVIRKRDIAEVFEVVAVADGMVAICGTASMVANGYRRFYVAAAREEADETRGGDYAVDFARMTIDPADDGVVSAVLAAESESDSQKGEGDG
jgi:replicative DNA helicase